jgi:hypothetical protein
MTPSTDTKDILLALHHENSAQARHHEQQRQWVTTIVAIAAALVMLALGVGRTTPLRGDYTSLLHGLLLCALGTFGFLASLHHHERSRLHVQRVHAVRRAVSHAFPTSILDLYAEANTEHIKRFPRLSTRTARVHYVWQGLHATIVFTGAAVIALVLLGPRS